MKIAFVALQFHLSNTKSSQFFIDILKCHFNDVHIISASDAWYDIPRIKPDILIIWQHLFNHTELEAFAIQNIILIPMYDACPHTQEFWNNYKPYKIFCFSKTLFSFLSNCDFDVYHAQYYAKPFTKNISPSYPLKAFYWERSTVINWECIKKLLDKSVIESFQYHTSNVIAQIKSQGPNQQDIQRFHIEFSTWFESMDEYTKILQNTVIYFAPRESEGIGLSFIEALAHGLFIVAPDAPTMNEYITHNVNGILYDQNNPQALVFEHINEIRKQALNSATQGYEIWNSCIPQIIDFIKKPLNQKYIPKKHTTLYFKKYCRAFIRHYYKKIMSFFHAI